MEPTDLDTAISDIIDEITETDLEKSTIEELAELHVDLRGMISKNNARQKTADTAIKICTTAIETQVGERLLAFGARTAVVPSGRFKVTTDPKIVYNSTDAKALLHWAVKNNKEHLLSGSLISSACLAEFEDEAAPVAPPDFIVRVEIEQTKITRT